MSMRKATAIPSADGVALTRTRLVFVAMVVFGASLFGTFLFRSPIAVAIPDVVLGGFILYGITISRRIALGPIPWLVSALAVAVLLSGVVNSLRNPLFDAGNFLTNYVRIIGIVGFMILSVPILRRIGPDALRSGTLWAVRINAMALLTDAIGLLPVWLSPSSLLLERPTGFFLEPGHFGVYVAFAMFYLIQLDRNSNHRQIRFVDVALMAGSIIISTGFRGLFLLLVISIAMVGWGGIRSQAKWLASLVALVLLLFAWMSLAPNSSVSQNVESVLSRIPSVLPSQFSDDSGRERVFGTWDLTIALINRAPIFGIGLGGANELQGAYYLDSDLIFLNSFGDLDSPGSFNLLTTVLQTSGVIGTAFFLLILLKMAVTYETRWIGFGFIAIGMVWGAIFESFIWWNVALAVSLMPRASAIAPRRWPQLRAQSSEGPIMRRP